MVRRCEGATVRGCACALIMLGLAPLAAQAPGDAKPSFEVATIKQNTTGTRGGGAGPAPGRFSMSNVPLKLIIRQAYRRQDYDLIGGPAWIESDRWDVIAKAPDGVRDPLQMSAMLQSLLEDRFKLVVHPETRELPMYSLVFARGDRRLGEKLRRSDVDCAALAKARDPNAPFTPPKPGEVPQCGIMMMTGPASAAFKGGAMQFEALLRTLGSFLGRPIVDKTGLTGSFDVDLTFAPDRSLMPGFPMGGPSGGLSAGGQPITDVPSLFTAVQEQLGLKLEPTRGPIEVLVIDSIERPTED